MFVVLFFQLFSEFRVFQIKGMEIECGVNVRNLTQSPWKKPWYFLGCPKDSRESTSGLLLEPTVLCWEYSEPVFTLPGKVKR
jgi:hypothetical protein